MKTLGGQYYSRKKCDQDFFKASSIRRLFSISQTARVTALPSNGGTALPICLNIWVLLTAEKLKSSLNDWRQEYQYAVHEETE